MTKDEATASPKDAALKLALDVLESDYVFEWPAMQRPERVKKKRFEAITAIKEALAQPEQEPVAVVDVHEFYDNCANFSLLQKLPKGKHTLYTTPPKRQPLTDDEAMSSVSSVLPVTSTGEQTHHWQIQYKYALEIVRAIEAKLKEKNT